jgi:DMSO reductase family type II enzyme chaperone
VLPNSDADKTILLNLDRARVYAALARVFSMPDGESLREAREHRLPELCEALERFAHSSVDAQDADLVTIAESLRVLFEDTGVEKLRREYDSAFDESSGSRAAPTEMDQLDGPPQLELTRTFELADVAGFYKAFGVEVSPGGQRVDHITSELEFMNLLAVKESIALQEEGEGEHALTCRDASRVFLRDHLERWAPRLGERLAESDRDSAYGTAGRLLSGFIAFDAEQIDAAGAPVHKLDPAARTNAPEAH